jgi:hypothetical protein
LVLSPPEKVRKGLQIVNSVLIFGKASHHERIFAHPALQLVLGVIHPHWITGIRREYRAIYAFRAVVLVN